MIPRSIPVIPILSTRIKSTFMVAQTNPLRNINVKKSDFYHSRNNDHSQSGSFAFGIPKANKFLARSHLEKTLPSIPNKKGAKIKKTIINFIIIKTE